MKRREFRNAGNRPEVCYYSPCRTLLREEFAGRLGQLMKEEQIRKKKTETVFLCIGTDRSTGDSLGPLVGYKLKQKTRRIPVFGTLDRPVHAMNLEQYQILLKECFSDALIVAVDASVGDAAHVGWVTMGKGSLRPGLGVCKELQAVGDVFITGIVGGCGSGDPLYLQSVRLSLVMQLADCISDGIALAVGGAAPEKEIAAAAAGRERSCRKFPGSDRYGLTTFL